jgi:uncharacterized membrane protein
MQAIFLSVAKRMVVFIAVLLVTLTISSTVVSQASKSSAEVYGIVTSQIP